MTDAAPRAEFRELRIPAYNAEDPVLWFAQVESKFRNAGITTQQSKYSHMKGALSGTAASLVRDLLLDEPNDDPYTTLKLELLRRVTKTNPQKIREALKGLPRGDRTPSQLLRDMLRQVEGADVGGDFIRTTFLDHLEPTTRQILALHDKETVTKLAEMADKIESSPAPKVVANISQTSTDSDAKLIALQEQILQMQITLSQIEKSAEISQVMQKQNTNAAGPEGNWRNNQNSSKNNNSFRYDNRSHNGRHDSPPQYNKYVPPHATNNAPGTFVAPQNGPRRDATGTAYVCYYHRRFGPQAFKCEPNCIWWGKKN